MFNYIGTVTSRKSGLAAGSADIYLVKVPQLSEQPVEAKVLATVGLVSYSEKEQVIVTELEPTEYLILGRLQRVGVDASQVSFQSPIYAVVDRGAIKGTVVLEGRTQTKTVDQLLDMLSTLSVLSPGQ